MRLALKLATGAGKTTVMAMLIAWQTIKVLIDDLLADSGSIFVQIGTTTFTERAVLDEVFGEENFLSQINVVKTSGLAAADRMSSSTDYILWFSKHRADVKYRQLLIEKNISSDAGVMYRYVRDEAGI